jgi:Xaa-Pro aminopeptidase
VDPFAVDLEACRGRQRRLLDFVLPFEADDQFLVVLTRRESVQWATGALVRAPFEPIAAITKSGHVTLALPDHQLGDTVAADELIGYEGKWHSTMRDEQRSASSTIIKAKFARPWKFIACEYEAFPPDLLFDWEPPVMMQIDRDVFYLRRHKDADELRLLDKANEANRAMYERAREIVRPGLNELELFAEMHRVAVQSLGETPTYFGQDFRFCHPGGPPRNRTAAAGELLILDLGVGFRGYHSDNARTIAVGEPIAEQQRAWKLVAEVFSIVQAEARPGVRCRHLYDLAHKHLNSNPPWTFNHHLGHGVGLAPHEGPHLNPRWDDTLAVGDFIAVEPGVYHETLRAGVRLEQNYLVTDAGVTLLIDWPLKL